MVDSHAMTLMTNSLEPQLSESLYYCEIVAELWQKIEKQHNNHKSHFQIYNSSKKL
jgi:hypothetical protein